MNANFTRFDAPVLGQETKELYETLYGNCGERFVEILNASPNEIAVISRLIAYLAWEEREGRQDGCEKSK